MPLHRYYQLVRRRQQKSALFRPMSRDARLAISVADFFSKPRLRSVGTPEIHITRIHNTICLSVSGRLSKDYIWSADKIPMRRFVKMYPDAHAVALIRQIGKTSLPYILKLLKELGYSAPAE